jgi:hypothetical protein
MYGRQVSCVILASIYVSVPVLCAGLCERPLCVWVGGVWVCPCVRACVCLVCVWCLPGHFLSSAIFRVASSVCAPNTKALRSLLPFSSNSNNSAYR